MSFCNRRMVMPNLTYQSYIRLCEKQDCVKTFLFFKAKKGRVPQRTCGIFMLLALRICMNEIGRKFLLSE